MFRDRVEGDQERQLSPAEQYRSSLVARLALVDTTASLERQLGVQVVDEERAVELAQFQLSPAMSPEGADQVMQAAVEIDPYTLVA
jgi:hypothetical protein